jgi:hypothetical protein
VLLGLPAFIADLRAAAAALHLPPAGVASALLQLAEQREQRCTSLAPEPLETLALRRALGGKWAAPPDCLPGWLAAGLHTAAPAGPKRTQRAACTPCSPRRPAPSRRARPRRWCGWRQEDAHEFLACALLDRLQGEVLAAEAAAAGGASVAPLSGTLCPVARNFSGTMAKSFTCRCAPAPGPGPGPGPLARAAPPRRAAH